MSAVVLLTRVSQSQIQKWAIHPEQQAKKKHSKLGSKVEPIDCGRPVMHHDPKSATNPDYMDRNQHQQRAINLYHRFQPKLPYKTGRPRDHASYRDVSTLRNKHSLALDWRLGVRVTASSRSLVPYLIPQTSNLWAKAYRSRMARFFPLLLGR